MTAYIHIHSASLFLFDTHIRARTHKYIHTTAHVRNCAVRLACTHIYYCTDADVRARTHQYIHTTHIYACADADVRARAHKYIHTAHICDTYMTLAARHEL